MFGIKKPYALPIRMFKNKEDDYCWEDYDEDYKKNNPIRYFLFNTLEDFVLMLCSNIIERPYYWFISKFIEKHHYIDIRNVINYHGIPYTGGYVDLDYRLDAGIVSIFKMYKKESQQFYEMSFQERYDELNSYDVKNEEIHSTINNIKEMLEIENFFEKELPERFEKESALLLSNKSNYNEFSDETQKLITKYLIKIINIRYSFWT